VYKNHTHCSVESVAERGATTPSPSSMRGLGRRTIEVEQETCLPRAIEDRGPLHDGLKTCYSETSTTQHIIYKYTQGCSELASSCETSSHRLCITRPGVPLPLPHPPKEENQQPPQKRLPINPDHHQCAAAGIDPIGSPHPRIQCSGPLEKDPHPEPASGRALTPSRTRFSSPLAIAREQDGFVPTTFPEGTQP
jgi:hypothetical protein